PKPRTKPVESHPTLVVRVDAAGRPSIGGNVIDEATLDELLRMSAADDRDTEVVVKAAPGAPHKSVVFVLEHAKAAGLHRMAIGTDDAP
ncbi:MAG TPA: biopolymer transporter ExbD, partial [Kofleriaceae bacterium]|nr:biopolymer transporter ExbD [Kofleriaceae bacterium]